MRLAFYLEGVAGRLFCTGALHQQGRRRKILIVPPFAEEMNKSRHVLAAISAALMDAGHDVLLPDLYGTGDSEGQFRNATLDVWRADLDVAIQRLNPGQDLEIIGLRAGALLAADAATRHPVKSLTLLHPLIEGRQQLNQMLRLRLAGGLLGGRQKETATQLKQQLAQGECLEIAGYGLSGQLAADLETLLLAQMVPSQCGQVNWIEIVAQEDRPLMPASQRLVDDWSAGGIPVECAIVACDQFWTTQEIAQCPGIVQATMKQFAS